MGPKYGYFPKASKSFLIVKCLYEESAKDMDYGLKVTITTSGEQHHYIRQTSLHQTNITTSGKQHLGTIIGNEDFKKEYVEELSRTGSIRLKSYPKLEPQSAYSAFVFEFSSKITYFVQTIPDMKELLTQLEETI